MDIAERQKPKLGELFLDHVAHFVPDLAAAAKLLEALGFVVTPESAHRADGGPAGTSNRCLMFDEGYIEILAPTLDTPNARRVRTQMARYDGVHLVCFGTPDAAGERRRLAAHGFDPEPVVNLERTVESGGTVRFSVVYVPPGKMPEGRIQYVQQLTPEQIWRPEYVAHENGVVGLAAVYVDAPDPIETAARWARFAGLLPLPQDDGVRLQAARGSVFVREGPMRAIAGYALNCRDPGAFLKRCREYGLAVAGERVQLPPALGGTWFIT
jgi:Glyoxalase-like domain